MIVYDASVRLDFVRGDATGLDIPAHGEALRKAGAAFLTEAFQKSRMLASDNSVTRITRLNPCEVGSSGQKLFLSVEYARPGPDLPGDLFVKFSRDFSDGLRDRGRREFAAEIGLAQLCRLPGFPISVSAAWFGDFHAESGTGILIAQRIRFGCGGIEPAHLKCMDHEPGTPLDYYSDIVMALARLAAAHKSAQLGAHLDAAFPFVPERAAAEDPMPYGGAQLRELVARYAAFAASYPQLLPANIATPHLVARLDREAILTKRHDAAIKRRFFPDTEQKNHGLMPAGTARWRSDGAGARQPV